MILQRTDFYSSDLFAQNKVCTLASSSRQKIEDGSGINN